MHNLRNLVKEKTCFKNAENLSCLDLILTNCSRSFQNMDVKWKTEHSDFRKMGVFVLKTIFPKQKISKVIYSDYKNFRNEMFRAEPDEQLSKFDIPNLSWKSFQIFFFEILHKQAPKKSKDVRASQSTFI